MPWLVRFNQTYRLQDRLNVTAWILTKSVTKGKNIRRGDKVFLATYAVILGSGVILCDPILADEAREELQFFTTQQAQQEFDQRVCPADRVLDSRGVILLKASGRPNT